MRNVRRCVVVCFMLLVIIFGRKENCYAQTYFELDDPEYWKAKGYIVEEFYGNDENEEYDILPYNLRGQYIRKNGIDVSKYQGNIDWAKAKAMGVEFAIVRVGYRGSGSGTLNEDPNYIKNIEGALKQGIRVGVYMFSQAINKAEAIEEANYVLSRIYKYNITLPVVIDFEYTGQNGASGRLYDAKLTKAQATSVCKAFCKTVENAGYTGMVYANRSMLTSGLNAAELTKDYRIWLAHYTDVTNYAGAYDFWQYTSKGDGYAYGMQSQYLDLNYWYDDGTIYGKDYSAVFDAGYYANVNADLKSAYGNDTAALLAHFVTYGMQEGRQGNASFNANSYRNAYKDLRDAYKGDMRSYYNHYINYGKNEGRVGTGNEYKMVGATTTYKGVDYAAIYDPNYYLNNNPDLLKAFGYDDEAAIAHFVNSGMNEGRQGCAAFNVQSYRNANKDLRSGYKDNLKLYYLHYLNYGKNEGRAGTGNETIMIGATTIYNGVDYSVVYDANYYLNNNPDLLKEYGYNDKKALEHFVLHGIEEGRQGNSDFNVFIYRAKYADLRSGFGNNLRSYYMHYINYGKSEGRTAR